jgi:coenzyme Q-binding protein COQ10
MPTFSDRVAIPYRPEQLFDLVADVGKYPEFLPWCIGATVRSRTDTELVADLRIGFGPFKESFTSRVSLERPHRIRVTYENGPFRYLNNQWVFTDTPKGTQVDFWVDFEFRNRLLQKAIGVVFSEAVKRMVSAFLKRARDTYGPPQALPMSGPAVPQAALRS